MLKKSICTLSFLISIVSIQAQINGVLNAAGRGVMKSVEKKVEKKAENYADKKLNEKYPNDTTSSQSSSNVNSQPKQQNNSLQKMPGMFSNLTKMMNAPCEEKYEFSTSITYLLQTDSIPQMNVTYWFPKEENYLATKISDSLTMVYDNKNKSIVTFIIAPEGKSYISMGATVKDTTKVQEKPKMTKTSQTKTITGYLCTLYKVDSENFKGDYWITNGLNGKITNFSSIGTTEQNSQIQTSVKEGFVMEMKGVDAKGEKIYGLVTSVITNASMQILRKDYVNVAGK